MTAQYDGLALLRLLQDWPHVSASAIAIVAASVVFRGAVLAQVPLQKGLLFMHSFFMHLFTHPVRHTDRIAGMVIVVHLACKVRLKQK
jgi:hypothetical protein